MLAAQRARFSEPDVGHTELLQLFFYDIGYRFATVNGNYNAQDGLDVLAEYARMYGLADKSGVEIEESQPSVSDELPIPSAIGQGTNSFTAAGLTRYVATVANGNCFNLTLLDHVQDKEEIF